MAKEKKANAALDKYKFLGTHAGGICGKTGVEYNINTITEQHIEGMIAKGSPLFEKKTKADASADKK